MFLKQSFDIDKKDNESENGLTALHYAIFSNNPITVELLLKEYNANPNVVDNTNGTLLMTWASIQDRNLSILRLLVKYRFDFARLVNEVEHRREWTAFHFLCFGDNTYHNITCIKVLFSICQKIPHCSINILTQNGDGLGGLHCAIFKKNVDMTKYLLENVYFPNNDKRNKDGVAFINMRMNKGLSLAAFVLGALVTKEEGNVKDDLEIFKLLVSYGMKVDSQDEKFNLPIMYHHAELVAFSLNQNLSPIYTFDKIMYLMYEINAKRSGIVNTEILKSLYNYGLEHGLIYNKFHHSQIIGIAAQYNLATFKTTMSMILQKHGIYDLKQYRQCHIIDAKEMVFVVQSPNTEENVKSFIKSLMCGDEAKLLKLDVNTSNKIVLTCINNHKLKNSPDNKIIHYRERCSVCGDSGNGSQSISGFECYKCKSFICSDCIIVQKLSKKIHSNGHKKSVLLAAANEILEYKNNKKLLTKVELVKRSVTFFSLSVCD